MLDAGMSYALLAGLPAVYGLYSAFVPCIVYAVFSSSPHLAVGPVAVISLLLGHSIRAILPESENIEDPNNPGDLADVQTSYNEIATQVLQLPPVASRRGMLHPLLIHMLTESCTSHADCPRRSHSWLASCTLLLVFSVLASLQTF